MRSTVLISFQIYCRYCRNNQKAAEYFALSSYIDVHCQTKLFTDKIIELSRTFI